MNVLTITGNLGSDGELRTTKTGTNLLSFSVAMTSGFGERKKTDWVRCTKFGKNIEGLAPYLITGGKIAVSGELSTSEWTNKEGVSQKSLELNVREITLLSDKIAQARQAIDNSVPVSTGFDDLESDLPF